MTRTTTILDEDARLVVDEYEDVLRQHLAGTTMVVTGANGLVCSFLCEVVAEMNRRLPDSPCRLLAVDNHHIGPASRLAHLAGVPGVQLLHHDVRDRPPQDWGPVDWYVHGASIASPMFYRRFPLETLDANVTGARLLLEHAASHGQARGFLLLSTSEIYGDPPADQIPTPESYRGNVACAGPRACYDESKRLAETLAWIFHHHHGVPAITARLFNVFGPGQRLDDERLMPDLCRAAVRRDPIVVHSDGSPTRAMCYLRDGVRGLLHVLLHGTAGETYNVGNDEGELSVLEIVRAVSEAAGGLEVRLQPSADVHYTTDNPQRRCPDITRLRSLGWAPTVEVDEGIRRALRSYQEDAS